MTTRFSLPDSFASDFKSAVEKSFGANLVFAFVFGSFAKQFGRRGHDIDTFVCVTHIVDSQTKAYLAWLRGAHERLGCEVDERYPCEIVKEAQLRDLERNARTIELGLGENSPETYDGVTWIQVLTDAKTCIVGSLEALRHFEAAFSGIPEMWKAFALAHVDDPLHLRDQPPLYFIKNFYRFRERPVSREEESGP